MYSTHEEVDRLVAGLASTACWDNSEEVYGCATG